MTTALNTIKEPKGARYKSKRLGRGIGSGKGKTCARGGKGQTARTGVAINGFEGGQMPIHRRLPKRGFNNTRGTDFYVVNLDDLQKAVEAKKFDAKAEVNAEVLLKAGLIRNLNQGVKILGTGELKTALKLSVAKASESAKQAVEKAGGSITLVEKAAKPAAEPKANKAKASKSEA